MTDVTHHIIAHIETPFDEKFGIPRQSGLVAEAIGTIVFEPEFRNPDALRGLEGFSHLWVLWDFSLSHRDEWSPTVRPPRLGGNQRQGVFATRSPFRPNPIGLSVVKILSIELSTSHGPVIRVGGVDMLNGTPIFDIKPYLPYADAIPQATGGFTSTLDSTELNVVIPNHLTHLIPQDALLTIKRIIALDPRPRYQTDDSRQYGISFAGLNIKFQIDHDTAFITAVE